MSYNVHIFIYFIGGLTIEVKFIVFSCVTMLPPFQDILKTKIFTFYVHLIIMPWSCHLSQIHVCHNMYMKITVILSPGKQTGGLFVT